MSGLVATLTSRINGDGSKVWVVRWRAGGRGTRQHAKTFAREGDAKRFRNAIARGKDLGQLASEVVGSQQTVEDFVLEWWARYAKNRLAPGTLQSYEGVVAKWILPLLGELRLRDLSRETVDTFVAAMRARGAGAPTVNRTLAILQGIMRRAVEWRRLPANPVAGTPRLGHVRDQAIDARSGEEVEAVRRVLGQQDAALVAVLAYEGLRPAEALALEWRDVLTPAGKPRARMRVARALSAGALSTTKTGREREPELFRNVSGMLSALYLAQGRPSLRTLVFPSGAGKHVSLHAWRRHVWAPALAKVWPCVQCAGTGKIRKERCEACAGTGSSNYFRIYDARHTCATQLLRDGWPVQDVAAHMGHADPGFTLKVYAHAIREAPATSRTEGAAR